MQQSAKHQMRIVREMLLLQERGLPEADPECQQMLDAMWGMGQQPAPPAEVAYDKFRPGLSRKPRN